MKNRTLKNVLCVIAGFVFIFVVIIGAFVGAYLIIGGNSDHKFHTYDNTLETTVPSGWDEVSIRGELNDASDIEIKNTWQDSYMIGFIYNKEDYEITYDELVERCFEGLEETYNVSITNRKILKTKNSEWMYVTYDTTYESTKLYMRAYIIETEHYYGEILLWSTASQKSYLSGVADDIVLSIKEL